MLTGCREWNAESVSTIHFLFHCPRWVPRYAVSMPPSSYSSGNWSTIANAASQVRRDYSTVVYTGRFFICNCPPSPSRTPQAIMLRLERSKSKLHRALSPAVYHQWLCPWAQSKRIFSHFRFPLQSLVTSELHSEADGLYVHFCGLHVGPRRTHEIGQDRRAFSLTGITRNSIGCEDQLRQRKERLKHFLYVGRMVACFNWASSDGKLSEV